MSEARKDWKTVLETLRTEGFPSPWKSAEEHSNKYLEHAIKAINECDDLLFENGTAVSYITSRPKTEVTGQGMPDYSKTRYVKVSNEPDSIPNIIKKLTSHFYTDMINVYHPLFVANLLPSPSIASLIAGLTSIKINANVVDEHYGMNVAKSELELSSMISHLLPIGLGDHRWPRPWAPTNPDSSEFYQVLGTPQSGDGSGGITTFGGTGCYLYGIKYALTHVANSVLDRGESVRADGLDKGKFVFLSSNQGHYANITTSDWSGLGYKSAIKVKTYKDNTMDLEDLRDKLNEAKKNNKVVIAVVCTVGTTDAGALDDVAAVREIIRGFENIVDPETKRPYAKPLIYADAVVGWVWLFFRDYDFKNNPLNFESDTLLQIAQNARKVAGIVEADAFGIDFHKTGFSHLPSSMVMIKDYGNFATLLERDPPAYLQQEQYDPALYTLETSRSSIGCLAAWATLKYLGKDGMRTLSYHLVDKQNYFRKKIRQTGFIVVCNEDNHSYSTLFRVYPKQISDSEFQKELHEQSLYKEFRNANEFQKLVYNELYKELRKNDGSAQSLSTPHFSMTTGYRPTYYNESPGDIKTEPDSSHPMQNVFALKCLTLSPFLDYKHVDLMVEHIMKARQRVVNNYFKKVSKGGEKKYANFERAILPKRVHVHNNLVPAKNIPFVFIIGDVGVLL